VGKLLKKEDRKPFFSLLAAAVLIFFLFFIIPWMTALITAEILIFIGLVKLLRS